MFSASLVFDYDDIQGPHSIDKEYTLAVSVTDNHDNISTNNTAATLKIQRVDEGAPTITQVKRNQNSILYRTANPVNKDTANYIMKQLSLLMVTLELI